MTDANRFTFADPGPGDATAEVVRRFIAAFQDRDAATIRALVAPDCVMEAIQPAPDGLRVEGYEANVAFWQAMVADPNGSFETEDVVISGDRATNRWRYRFGAGDRSSVRGVTLIRFRDGRIAEALAYAKTPVVADLGQASQTTSEVVRRFNEVFQEHDPSALPELIAATASSKTPVLRPVVRAMLAAKLASPCGGGSRPCPEHSSISRRSWSGRAGDHPLAAALGRR